MTSMKLAGNLCGRHFIAKAIPIKDINEKCHKKKLGNCKTSLLGITNVKYYSLTFHNHAQIYNTEYNISKCNKILRILPRLFLRSQQWHQQSPIL